MCIRMMMMTWCA